MQTCTPHPTQPSLTFALAEKTRGQARVNALINEIESASAAGDGELVERLHAAAEYEIAELEARGGDGHSAPAWLAAVLRGNAAGAAGRYADALVLQMRGLTLARDARQAARCRNNASDHLRRLGRTAEAAHI